MSTAPLEELAALTQQLRSLEALTRTRDRLILTCRDHGATWAEIADAIGVPRQVAQNMGQNAKKRLNRSSDAPKR